MQVKKKLVAFRTICNNCGHDFETYDLSDFSYGERILLTEDGIDYAYLNCIDDEVFMEIDNIIKLNLNDFETGSLKTFNQVFGIACDKINEKTIDASREKRSCLKCNSSKLSWWEYEPPKVIEKSIYLITYNDWSKLSYEEKVHVINKKLEVAESETK